MPAAHKALPAGWTANEQVGACAMADREVYFEFRAIGPSVKVTAIDSVTAIEVSIVGPANAPQAELQRVALQKLKARLAREQGR